jgi:hypothetical protein
MATISASAGALTLASASTVQIDYVLTAETGELVLTADSSQILVPTPEVFRVGVMVDLIPDNGNGNYQRYTERLRFNGTDIPVRAWSFDQSQGELGGRLTVELANISDRLLVGHNTPVTFEVGEWDGSQFVYSTLLDTGKLLATQYNISSNGVGPNDSFTLQAASRMEDALNLTPNNNLVYYDPDSISADVGDFEGIYETDGSYIAPVVTPISDLTWQGVLDYIPGFDDIRTNIPDFPVKLVQFQAGVPYINAISGIIGMFEPILSAIEQNGDFILYIQDGTSVIASAMPDPRDVSIDKATSLGLSDEVPRTGALILSIAENRRFFDYTSSRFETTVATSEQVGGERVVTTTETIWRDYYRFSNPSEPIKSEVVEQIVEQRIGSRRISEVTDSYVYDSLGNLQSKERVIKANIADPAFNFEQRFRQISRETETHFYSVHPFEPELVYRRRFERKLRGLFYIDTENPQLDEPYRKYAVDALRAGNVNEDMTIDSGDISLYIEEVAIRRKNQVLVTTYEVDYLSGQISTDQEIVRDGAVGVNAFVDEQRRYYIYREGETEIDGQVEQINMGELPFTMAVALGRKILRNREHASERVRFDLIGIDTSLVRGMAINPIAREDDDLGNYIIDARGFRGGPNGYSMSLEARSAKRQ